MPTLQSVPFSSLHAIGNADFRYNTTEAEVEPGSDKKDKADSSPQNFGERMYQTAMIKKKQRDKEAKEKQRARELKELEDATFVPEINRRYRTTLSGTKLNSTLRAEDRLYNQAAINQTRIEDAKVSKLLQEQGKCTFQPQIDSKYHFTFPIVDRSKAIAVARDRTFATQMPAQLSEVFTKNRYGLLFEDAKRRVIHMKRISQTVSDLECTFSPNTRLTKCYPREHESEKTFLQRNEIFLLGREERKHRAESQSSKSFTFSPSVGRAPRQMRREPSLPIGEYLYQRQIHAPCCERSQSVGRICTVTAANGEMSKTLVDNRVECCFRKIFEVLDSDSDGKITGGDANVEGTMKGSKG